MKNLFIYAAVIAATMGSMTACSDFLDVKPVTNKQEPDFCIARRYYSVANWYVR